MRTIFSRTNILERFVPMSLVPESSISGAVIAVGASPLTRKVRSHRPLSTVPQAGFSLVELMIAIGIGMVILLAITVLFAQVSGGFRSTDDAARAMENGNFAMRVISDDLRLVGFVGLSNSPMEINFRPGRIQAGAADNCGDATWPYLQNGAIPNTSLQHIAAPGTLPCIPAGSIDANSPVIVTRHATGLAVPAAAFVAGGSLANSNRMFIQSGTGGSGYMFMGRDYSSNPERYTVVCRESAPPGPCAAGAAETDAPIFEYAVHVYYIRPCSRPTGAVCIATDDGGQWIPTLVRRQLNENNPAGFVETTIAEGVERLTVQYLDSAGVDVPLADLWKTDTARVSVLVRSRKLDSQGFDDAQFTYTLSDGTAFNCGAAGSLPCGYRRYLLSDTIALKNFPFQR